MTGVERGSTPSLIRIHHRLEEGLLLVLMACMLLLAFGQIALRNLFDITILWADPLVRHLVLWTSFLGALIATRQGRHIRIDALWRILPPAGRRLAHMLTSLCSAVVCAVMSWVAVRFVADERTFGDVGLFDLPVWLFQLVFPLTFGLMALRFLDSFCRDGVAWLRGRPA